MFVGEMGVARIGATSGYAVGTVINDDATVEENNPSENLHLIVVGVAEVSASASGGDSGGPVFLDHCGLRACGAGATILGIEFAKDSATGNFYFSPLANIYQDLSVGYTVFGTTVSMFGPSLITAPGNYTWSAYANGSSGYHYQWQISYAGTNWEGAGTDSSQYSQYWQQIGQDLYYYFWIRVVVTGGGEGPGQVAVSDSVYTVVSGRGF